MLCVPFVAVDAVTTISFEGPWSRWKIEAHGERCNSAMVPFVAIEFATTAAKGLGTATEVEATLMRSWLGDMPMDELGQQEASKNLGVQLEKLNVKNEFGQKNEVSKKFGVRLVEQATTKLVEQATMKLGEQATTKLGEQVTMKLGEQVTTKLGKQETTNLPVGAKPGRNDPLIFPNGSDYKVKGKEVQGSLAKAYSKSFEGHRNP